MTQTTEAIPSLTPEQITANKAAFEYSCIENLASFWRTADILPAYPADTETVVEIMAANEYDVDLDVVNLYLTEKAIQSPERRNGRLAWSATNIVMLATALEFRRRWKKFSRMHGHKLTQFERLEELASANGQSSCFNDLAVWDIAGLLALLHEPGCDLGARQALAVALAHKLREQGVQF